MTTQDNQEKKPAPRRRLAGVVVSRSGAKTIAVEVVREVRHPVYNKKSKWTKRYLAHDEREEAAVGQSVTIEESRPISRRKRWVLVREKINTKNTAAAAP